MSDANNQEPVAQEARDRAAREVAAAYRSILLREPDPLGLQSWTDLLVDGRIDLQGMLQALLASDEFAGRVTEFFNRYVNPALSRFTNDYSQFGEIWMLVRDMVNQAARHRVIVDVGANGRMRSNSYDLLRHFGWRGLLFEANPKLVASINKEFAGLNYRLVNCAISDYSGRANFYIGVNDDVSSLNKTTAENWGEVRDHVEVRVERLAPILASHAIPHDFDVLSIDAEGEDIKILNDVMLADYRPGWVIIEASDNFRTKTLQELDLLPAVTEWYRIIGQTSANLILRRRDR